MSRLACIAFAAALTGCAVWSPDDAAEEEERRGPITPIEALQQTEEPERDRSGYDDDPGGLSGDIERLQDARRKYEHERDREAADRKRRRAECVEKGETREVPIEDGGKETLEYCAPQGDTNE